MENLSTLEIVGIIVVVVIFGGFLWRVAKRLFTFALIALLIILGIYMVKPEILHDWFGEDNVQKVEHVVKEQTDEAKKAVKEKTTEVVKDLDSN